MLHKTIITVTKKANEWKKKSKILIGELVPENKTKMVVCILRRGRKGDWSEAARPTWYVPYNSEQTRQRYWKKKKDVTK